jgi:hypothetical protein
MTRTPWLPADLVLLDDRCPLPLGRPFTAAQARQLGVSRWLLRVLLDRRLIRPVVHAVYVATQVVDTIELRSESLCLVVPETAIVTDRTAAWLHGVDLLPRSAVHAMPPVQVFGRTGSRLRRPGVASGKRQLLDSDVMVVNGVLVTTMLRTALDLGRGLHRYDALGALDALLRAGVDREALLGEVGRFAGERGVVQLRFLAPLADPRAESPAESTLRLHWYEAGLPTPELQICVHDDMGRAVYRVDLGLPDLRLGAEYNGRAFHGEDRREHDEERLSWLEQQRSWHIEVFVDDDVYAPGADPAPRLRAAFMDARTRSGLWVPQGHYLR